MSLWINEEIADKQYILHKAAEEKNISSEHTVEKDWWVTAVLTNISKVQCFFIYLTSIRLY